MNSSKRLTAKLSALLLVAGLLAAAFSAGPAGAIVPPKRCGTVTVSHHRYKVSADQIACKTARTYSVRMLKSRTYHPPHWTCARYKKSETSLVFRCENRHHTPIQTVFAAR